MSGGADSTALLVGLVRLARSRGDALAAAHLDHGVRGRVSREDADAVARLCAVLGVPLIAGRWSARGRVRGSASEDALRRVRLDFLRRSAHRVGADFIATAHTADDQLETLLLRLGRGTGLAGLAGMRPRRARWLKPLLECTRADIEADLRDTGIAWRHDASNGSRAYARNRLRRDVVPVLVRALWPGSEPAAGRRTLARHAALAARAVNQAVRVLSARARRAVGTQIPRSSDGVRLPVAPLRRLPPAVRDAAWRRMNRLLLPKGPAWTRAHTEALDALARGRAKGPIALPGGFSARSDGTAIEWRARSIEGRGKVAPGRRRDVPLAVPGQVSSTGLRVSARWVSVNEARLGLSETPSGVQYFAASGLRGRLRIRTASDRESFTPFGRSRPVRLGSFLKKLQHPAAQRRYPTVLSDARGILWIIGVRRSARAPLGRATRKVLRVTAERHD